MKIKVIICFFSIFLGACKSTPYSDETTKNNLRAPAYPLLTLHPHMKVWSMTDELNNQNVTFGGSKQLPFIGFLRVDGVVYRFMGSKELSMQAIAPMALDHEKWEAKFTCLVPDEGWEQPGFDDKRWQVSEGAFGTPGMWEAKTQWVSSDIWVRREVDIDPYLLEHKKIYLRYSHDDVFQLYINGKQLVSTGYDWGANFKVEVPDSILQTMKGGKAILAAHCENREGGGLVDFGLFAEEPTIPVETLAPISYEKEWTGKYTMERPKENWETAGFDDTAWTEGQAAFGTSDQRNVHTPWFSPNIWVRRKLTFDPSLVKNKQIYLRYSHDDVFQLYVNGMQLVSTGYEWKSDLRVNIPDSIVDTMKDGQAVIAAHCENRMGGALVDFGLYAESKEARQKSVDVQATQTHYTFECGDVELKLSFTAPYLLDDLETLARPVNYISYQAKALDNNEHDVAIYFEIDPHKAFDAGQSTQMYEKDGLALMKTGKENQKLWVNKEREDRAWGYFYLGTKDDVTCAQGDAAEMRAYFMKEGDLKQMRKSNEKRYAAFAQKLDVDSDFPQHLTAAFDGLYTMAYFGDDLLPYWNKDGEKTIEDLYVEAEEEYKEVMAKCYEFDRQLMADAYRVGGKEYAELCALAYRQSVSAFQMSESPEGELLYFTPQVGPVDEYYPASPLYLRYNPKLVEAMLNPFFYYSESGKWGKPYPVHDLGGYPIVNGQTVGGDMPVEEAGNALIMTAAIAKMENNASYAEKHWETLTHWAEYLLEIGTDTGDQLTTDNFAGGCHHHANLSAKSILGIASYAKLAEMLNKKEEAKKYMDVAREMVKEWEESAYAGDHYRLAFDQPDSWGMKYNLVWDRLLDLNLFPERVIQKEMDFYLTKMNEFGCPLDSRHSYTKTDWTVWTGSLSTDSTTFRKFILPIHKFMNETKDRVPMADFINTDRATIVDFRGRSVVGGYFIRLLEQK
ncbi:glutaminase family protein [Bacteroides bouchesdurhonensis]|uniref:glutaminase family protein n=1 Tax=Bacteroides bouchesdurhonensis TaxID=1841855 RepID=UPI00097F80FD|nr:glutaminase family protein [Bacteroides bouchesdurhonensis]